MIPTCVDAGPATRSYVKVLGSLELNKILSGGDTSRIWALSRSVFR